MDRLYLVVIVSAFVVLVTAAGLLVTKTHIVARHAHRPPFVRIGEAIANTPVASITVDVSELTFTNVSPRTLSSASTLQQSKSALTRSL